MRDKPIPILAKHWRRFVPETLLVLLALLTVDHLVYAGDQFAQVTPHPFWLPVLMAATQYGIAAGMFAAAVCSLALFADGLPAHIAGQDYYDYVAQLTTTPALWFTAALLFGGLRAIQIRSAERTENDLYEVREQASAVAEGFERARDEIKKLETRIAGDTSTVDGILRRLSRLDRDDTTTFAPTLAGLAADMIGASEVTLFLDTASGFQSYRATDAALREPPVPGPAAFAALLHSRRAVTRSDFASQAVLPEGVTLLAPIQAPSKDRLLGAIAVGALRDPTTAVGKAAGRAELVGQAIGALLVHVETRPSRTADGQNIRRLAGAD
jgi:hypothetical protein